MRFEAAGVGDHGEKMPEQRVERVRRTGSPPRWATLSAWRADSLIMRLAKRQCGFANFALPNGERRPRLCVGPRHGVEGKTYFTVPFFWTRSEDWE